MSENGTNALSGQPVSTPETPNNTPTVEVPVEGHVFQFPNGTFTTAIVASILGIAPRRAREAVLSWVAMGVIERVSPAAGNRAAVYRHAMQTAVVLQVA